MFDTPETDYVASNNLNAECKITLDNNRYNLDFNKINSYDTKIIKYKNYLIAKKANPSYEKTADQLSMTTNMKSNMGTGLSLGQWTATAYPTALDLNSLQDYIIMDNDNTFETIMCLYFADFWYQYFTQLETINTNDGHVDNYNIKNHIFEFKNKYRLNTTTSADGTCTFNFNKETSEYTIKFKIKTDLTTTQTFSSQFLILEDNDITQPLQTNSVILTSFRNILDLHRVTTFERELFYYKDNSQMLNNYILNWKHFKYNCELMLLLSLYEFLQDITGESNNDDKKSKIKALLYDLLFKYNNELDEINTECQNILDEKSRITNLESEGKLKYIEKSEQIKNAKDDTSNLFNLNKDILTKSQQLKHKKNIISDEKKKLDKINIVLIFTIILFIIVSLILLFSSKINNSIGYQLSLVFILVIIGIYILVYTYISISVKNVNISDKLSVFKKLFNAGDLLEDFSVVIEEPQCIRSMNTDEYLICILSKLKTREQNVDCYLYENRYQSDYYKMIEPLLKNELKDFNNKKQGSKLHNNIADFNLSSNKRDLKVNIETIMYLMNISLLIGILLVSKYYFPNFFKLIGIICIMLFIILSFIYFARVLKIVRTKSYNYYWQKPELLKKLI